MRRNNLTITATSTWFQSTHSLRSATRSQGRRQHQKDVSIHALLAECDGAADHIAWTFRVSIHALLAECDGKIRKGTAPRSCFNPRTPCGVRRWGRQHTAGNASFNPRTPCGVRPGTETGLSCADRFQSTHSLRSATAPNLIHCYSTKQIILCANLPKKTVIARLLFLSIYLSIFYSQCITPIADLPGNSCELEVGAQAMFNSL